MDARRGIGPAWVALALGALVAIAFVIASRVEDALVRPQLEVVSLHALAGGQGAVVAGVIVANPGEHAAELLDVSVPGIPNAVWGTGTSARTLTIAPHGTARLLLTLPAPCPKTPTVDHVDVRVRVGDQALEQALDLGGPVEVSCS